MYKGEILLCIQEERLTNKKNFLVSKNQLIIVLILQKKSFKIDKVVFTTQEATDF